MDYYAFHIRRKSGQWQTELKIHQGKPPKENEIAEVQLGDETVKVRVGVVTVPQTRDRADPVLEVHADEI